MKEKIALRKKAFSNRKKKYFEITSNFFYPLIKLLKKKKIKIKKMYLQYGYMVPR